MKRRRRNVIRVVCAVLVTAGLGLWWQAEHPPQAELADGEVDLERLIRFAQRCNDSYHEHHVFRREYGDHIEIGEFPASGLRIYLDAPPGDGEQWVMLRGTANLPNVIEDLEFIGHEEHDLGIAVHSGFDAALRECLPWVVERLDSGRPVFVTGHSLGGAVAVLLMASLEHRGFNDVSGITFGQPKVSDARGALVLSKLDLIRVVHDEDPVPMLPPVFVEVGEIGIYHHSGPEIVVRHDGRVTSLLRHLEDRLNVVQSWRDLRRIDPIHHDMTMGYLPALKKAKSRAGRRPGKENG